MNEEQLINLFGKEWYSLLKDYLLSKRFLEIGTKIAQLRTEQTVFPEKEKIFRSFKESNPKDIKVVFIVNDGITKDSCGHTLCCCEKLKTTNRLNNFIKEIYSCYPELERSITPLDRGNLEYLTKQGVFFLNTHYTDNDKLGQDHTNIWYNFICRVIEFLNKEQDIIWIVMGKHMVEWQNKINFAHTVLECPYPGDEKFEGCGIFRRIDTRLEKLGLININW